MTNHARHDLVDRHLVGVIGDQVRAPAAPPPTLTL